MRKHPLLAFFATSTGLAMGAITIGANSANASTTSKSNQIGASTLHTSTHRHHRHASHRRMRNARLHHAGIVSTTGPAGFLLPSSASLNAIAHAPVSGGVWAMLRTCESGNNYGENSGNGYYGAYQFTMTSWLSVGGTGLPNLAPPAAQDLAAKRLLAIQGWHAWPTCSVILGLA